MNQENDHVFDIAVIGGGIAGAAIARDAALRKLDIVLFEKNTFGSGTSSKSSKLIHGGLRYLELAWKALKKGDLKESWKNYCFVCSALRETGILEKIAPDLVRPIELIVPIYKNDVEKPWAVYAGTFFYGILAMLFGNSRFPRIFFWKRSILNILPELNAKDLVGGVAIWDRWTDDKQLVDATIRSAMQSGAQAFEGARVTGYRFAEKNQRYEINVQKNGGEATYYAHTVLNASGPWVDKIRQEANERTEDFLVPVAGCHIMLKKFTNHSVILRAQDKRIFFIINIGDQARVGTTERIYKDPDTVEPLEEEVEYLLCALEKYFPKRQFKPGDILSQDAGIRPLARPIHATTPHEISRDHEIRVGPTGVICIMGVKLTDHRRAAKEILDHYFPRTKSITHRVRLNESQAADHPPRAQAP